LPARRTYRDLDETGGRHVGPTNTSGRRRAARRRDRGDGRVAPALPPPRAVSAKSLLLGNDLLACVMGGVYTDVEKTMIELQRSTIVQETRNAFQEAMRDRFIRQVQHLTGRNVMAFISNHSVGPDIEIELFFLTPASESADPASTDQPGRRD